MGSSPSATACCFPREFTRHWPPIFGMKLPPFSSDSRQGLFHERRAKKRARSGRGGARATREGSGRLEGTTHGSRGCDFSTRRIITFNIADDTRAIRRGSRMLTREYITHCIPPINRRAVNGDITARLNARAATCTTILGNGAMRRRRNGIACGWYGADYRSNLAPRFQRASLPNLVI